MTYDALRILRREGLKNYEHRFVFWSGGRDSTVCLHLALRAWRGLEWRAVFIDTGITLPETLEYVNRLADEWGIPLTILKPEQDFYTLAKRWGFPAAPNFLWCREHLKLKPTRKFYSHNPGWKLQVLGLRRREAARRRTIKPVMDTPRFKYTVSICPILGWTVDQVKAYMRKHRIPTNPAYRIYGTSGCYFCPFIRNRKFYLTLKTRHPNLFNRLINLETHLRNPRAFKTFALSELTPQVILT